MLTERDIFNAALQYKDVPWKHQGRSRHGIDCLGLIVCVAIDLELPGAENISRWDSRDYGRIPPNRLARSMIEAGLLRSGQAVPGAVVLFASRGTYPSHVGILGSTIYSLELVHAHAPDKKVVHHLFDQSWKNDARAYFKYPGVNYG